MPASRRTMLAAMAASALAGCAGPAGVTSGGRATSEHEPGERWVEADVPPHREGWAALLREKEEAGVTGIVVRWDPRLIDLLRNPEPDDRSDLLMSTG